MVEQKKGQRGEIVTAISLVSLIVLIVGIVAARKLAEIGPRPVPQAIVCPTPEVACTLSCPDGFATDINNCPICACAPTPTSLPPLSPTISLLTPTASVSATPTTSPTPTLPPTVKITTPLNNSIIVGNTVTVRYQISGDLNNIEDVVVVFTNMQGVINAVVRKLVSDPGEAVYPNVSPGFYTASVYITRRNALRLINPESVDGVSFTVASANTTPTQQPPTVRIYTPIQDDVIATSSAFIKYTEGGDLNQVDHVHLTLDNQPEIRDLDNDGLYIFNNLTPGPHSVTAFLAKIDHSKFSNPESTYTITFSVNPNALTPSPQLSPTRTPSPTPSKTPRQRCEDDGISIWKTFSNSCVDSCERLSESASICLQALTDSCDCGSNKCWNGDDCVPNPPITITKTPTPTPTPQLCSFGGRCQNTCFSDQFNINDTSCAQSSQVCCVCPVLTPPPCYTSSSLIYVTPAPPKGCGYYICGPTFTPTPTPSCTPRPPCLDTPPYCQIPEPIDGWCKITPTPTPTLDYCPTPPPGCKLEIIQCVTTPCCPIINCPTTPTSTPPTTISPPPCPLKAQGDANCNGKITLVDFEIWRREYTGASKTTNADFNSDNKVTLVDFEIWRRTFTANQPTSPPTSTPKPTATPTPKICLPVLTPGRNIITRECRVFNNSCLPAEWIYDPSCSNAPTYFPPRPSPTPVIPTIPIINSAARGYLTTPQELAAIKYKADRGVEPYKSAVTDVLSYAASNWNYNLSAHETCSGVDDPFWLDDSGGLPILYAKALSYHLTGKTAYAEEVKNILERIMTDVKTIASGIGLPDEQCRVNFSWGTPELIAAADLIEDFWRGKICTGPTSTIYDKNTIGSGQCKELFQNWLVKNVYFVVSYSTTNHTSHWGAAATNAAAYIADYLWDRPNIELIHRNPPQVNIGVPYIFNPRDAYQFMRYQTKRRMNQYAVEYGSPTSCDFLSGSVQNPNYLPVKSGITDKGILPEDAKRLEYCNIPKYNGTFQDYPQTHLGNNIQQCELMLRRGDRSCYDNMDFTDVPKYTYQDPNDQSKTTHLYPGRGSIEKAINAIIIDSNTDWRLDQSLAVAYRYYYVARRLFATNFGLWAGQIGTNACNQDVCFGVLTHGFAPGESPSLPPTVPQP